LGKLVQKKNSVASDCSKVVLDVEHHLTDLGKKFADLKIGTFKYYASTFSGLFGGKLAIMHHIATFKVQKFTLSVNSQEHKMLDLMLNHLEHVR
jgi:hypothetical protein